MKLLRHGEFGNEKPGIIDHEGKIRDLSSHIPDINGDSINSESLKKIGGTTEEETLLHQLTQRITI